MLHTQHAQRFLARKPRHCQLFCTLVVSTLLLGLSGCGGGGGGHSSSDASGGAAPVTPVASYKLGGTISGLESPGLVLSNGSSTVSPAANNASFSFTQNLTVGASYNITVQTQPALARCVVTNGNGTMPANDYNNIVVTCSSNFIFTVLRQLTDFDGTSPEGSLIEGNDGRLYGLTSSGGSNGQGVVFAITPTGFFTTLHQFSGVSGQAPQGTLLQGHDSNLYGVTFSGGANNQGTLFKIPLSGTYTALLHSFDGNTGGNPISNSLIQANDGNFYGMTPFGGTNSMGTVFKMSPSGMVTPWYSFSSSTGRPYGSLIQASDSHLYGLTAIGGTAGCGSIFKLTLSGALTVLHSFSCNSEGGSPYGNLIEGADGNFYGMAYNGGTSYGGVVFKVTPSGDYSVLHHFGGGSSNAAYPTGSLVLANDGNFYGMTTAGGTNNDGTIFKIKISGEFKILHSFTLASDGGWPGGSLMQASDGNLYGMTPAGGSSNGGTIFQFAVQ